MLSDIQIAEAAEAELNAPLPVVDTTDVEPSIPQGESDRLAEEAGNITPEEPQTTEEAEVEPKEKVLPVDHDPDATLLEEERGEKEPQYRTDAKNLAEKWDFLTDDEQSIKLERLQKAGRFSTLKALAQELGTTPDKLLQKEDVAEKESEITALKEELNEVKSVLTFAQQQSENDRFVTEINKWAEHNKFTPEETKQLLDVDGELRSLFRGLKFDPETGEKLSYNKRLRIALKQSDSVQEKLNAKMIQKGLAGTQEGIKASIPSGTPNTVGAPVNRTMSAEEELRAQDEAFGRRTW